MKNKNSHFFYIILLILLCTSSIYSQTKKDKEIIIQIPDKDTLVQALIASENYIENDEYGVLTTKLRATTTRTGWSFQYHYQIIIKENTATIRPYWTNGIGLQIGGAYTDAQLQKWKWHKNKKSNINGIIANETVIMLNKAGIDDITYQ